MPANQTRPNRSLTATFAALVISMSLLPTAAFSDESAVADEVLGTVGDFEVRISEVLKSLESLGEAEREALRKDPTSLSQYVRAILVQRLVLREAMAAKWDKSAVVAERMNLLRDGVVANTWLESVGAPPETYPSETELTAAYDANRETFLQPKSWHLAQIFVAAPRRSGENTDSPEVTEKVKRITEALQRAPAGFATLATAESDDPTSAAKGGEIGWLPENRVHPDIRAVLPGMKLGAISAPVRMDDGWHIIKVIDIREAHIPTLEQIRDPLIEQMRAEKAGAGTETYLGELLRENPIAINEMVLSKLLPDPVD